jgi:hypothetical protein
MSPKTKKYIKARLREPSTWRGVILLLTAVGVPIAPAMGEAVITVGLALAGGVGVVMPDGKDEAQ